MADVKKGDLVWRSFDGRQFKVVGRDAEPDDQALPEGVFRAVDLEIAREAQADYDRYLQECGERVSRAILGPPSERFDFLGDVPKVREWLGQKAWKDALSEVKRLRDEAPLSMQFPPAALEQAACRTPSDGHATIHGLSVTSYSAATYGYNPYPPVPKAPEVGDKRPDVACKKCKNKGKVVVKEVELDFHSQKPTAKLFCKLCGADQ